MKKIKAVIPAFNAESTIGNIVKKTLSYVDEVIVVDDGSKDQTYQVAFEAGAKVYKLAKNYGAGFATNFGLESVWESEAVVTLDSDGQHNPSDIPVICEPIFDNGADLVIGSRFMELGKLLIPKYRRLGIGIITEAYNLGHKPITDAQCCFRAFRVSELYKILPWSHGFGFSTEMLIRARKNKLRIVEVPISCTYRNLREDSSMHPIKQGISVLLDTILWRARLLN